MKSLKPPFTVKTTRRRPAEAAGTSLTNEPPGIGKSFGYHGGVATAEGTWRHCGGSWGVLAEVGSVDAGVFDPGAESVTAKATTAPAARTAATAARRALEAMIGALSCPGLRGSATGCGLAPRVHKAYSFPKALTPDKGSRAALCKGTHPRSGEH
jgi:hypothetical protein